MNLHTLRLLSFSIIMEQGAGIADKSPDDIWTTFNRVYSCTSVPELRSLLPADLAHKLDNWLQVWGQALAAQGETASAPSYAAAELAVSSPPEITTHQEAQDVPDHSA